MKRSTRYVEQLRATPTGGGRLDDYQSLGTSEALMLAYQSRLNLHIDAAFCLQSYVPT
jgi:hypothetical protein